MQMRCFECGGFAESNHHVVPKSRGGTKTVPLCLDCHGKVHGKDFVKMKTLQLEGLRKRREAGLPMGGRKVGTRVRLTLEKEQLIKQLYTDGVAISEISRRVSLSRPTIYKVINEMF